MRKRTAAAFGLIVVLAVLVVGRMASRPDPFIPLVQEIVRTPQTYDGEHVDKLVALGPGSVSAIGSVMLSGQSFPIVFVSALERLGDERGAGAVVEFVGRQAPYSSADQSTLTAASILALRGMRNPDACKPLVSILRNETAHPRVRLASASASARLCSGDLRAEAQSFVLGAYQGRSQYLADPNEGFTPDELYSALIDADNDESMAILRDLLELGVPLPVAQPMITYLARKDEGDAVQSLQRLLDDSSKELPLRLAVARAIVDSGRPPSQALRDQIEDLVTEATPDVYGQEIADQAQALRARAAEL